MLLAPASFCPVALSESGPESPAEVKRADLSDEFNGASLDPKWSWYNPPASYDVGTTSAGQLHIVANRNTNFGGSSDSGVLLYQNASGNFSIETKLSSDPGTNFEKAGIMVRNNASNWVSLFYQAQNGKQVELTTKVGGSANDNLKAVTASPVWLRLERDGQTFTAYHSTDGANWTFGWSVGVALADSVSIGLVIADGNANADYAGDFDFFRVGPPNHAPAIIDPFTTVAVDEDELAGVRISDHILDPDGDMLTFEVTDAAHVVGSFNETRNDLEVGGATNWFGAEFANIKATDRLGASIKAQIRVNVTPVPDAPYLKKPVPDIVVPQAGVNSSTNLSACFFDNDTLFGGTDALSFACSGAGQLQVDIGAGGLVTVTAPVDFWGNVTPTFTATDRTSLSASAQARIAVYHVNQAPQVKAAPPDTSVNEDDSVTVYLGPVFWDPDGDAMSFEASGQSQVAVSFDRMNATFTPAPDASGFTERITLRSRDEKSLASPAITINVTVISVNDPPRITTISPPGNVTLMENDVLDFSVAASDQESGAGVTYAWFLDGLAGATGVTGFTFRTDYGSAGDHVVQVEVGDGEMNVSTSWTITVKNVNREPSKVTIIAPKAGATFKEGVSMQFEGDATDPDNDALAFSWIEGLVELGTGRNLSTTLGVGVHKITLEAFDGFAAARSATISITVKANTKPTILSVEPSKGKAFVKGTSVPVTAEVIDADGDALVFCWTENGRLIGTNQSFQLTGLAVGKHRVQLSVSDGTAVVQQTADFEVVEQGAAAADTSMYLIGGLLAVLAVAVVIAVLARGKKKEPVKPADFKQPELKW